MRAKLVEYNTKENYETETKGTTVSNPKTFTVSRALEFAKKEIRKYRGTHVFIGYKIFDENDKLIYKLPLR